MYEKNNMYNVLNNTSMKLIYNTDSYDIVSGRLPIDSNEIVIILDKDNNISKEIIDMFFINKSVLDYTDLLGKKVKLINNNEFYNNSLENTFTINKDLYKMYNNESNYTLKIVGILKEKDELLSTLGYNDNPSSIYIYPNDFNSKNKLIKKLDIYNRKFKKKDKILYVDYSKEVSDITYNMIKSITSILIAFSSISLIVSSIMIGIITYISVLEKERQIGILRGLGTTKKDITLMFLTELFLIGILSSFFSILLTKIVVIPLNITLFNLTGLKNVALLNINHFIIIFVISVLINLIGGFIPSLLASKKDPIKAINNN